MRSVMWGPHDGAPRAKHPASGEQRDSSNAPQLRKAALHSAQPMLQAEALHATVPTSYSS